MRLFVDDFRPCPAGWVLARSVDEAKSHLSTGSVEAVSLDHDLGSCEECRSTGVDIGDMRKPETTFFRWCPHVEDGVSLAQWMVHRDLVPPSWVVHSQNPVGRAKMVAILSQSEA